MGEPRALSVAGCESSAVVERRDANLCERAAPRRRATIFAGRARDDHEWEKVLLARVAEARLRSLGPLGEELVALARRSSRRGAKPRVELRRAFHRARVAEAAHVVERV